MGYFLRGKKNNPSRPTRNPVIYQGYNVFKSAVANMYYTGIDLSAFCHLTMTNDRYYNAIVLQRLSG